MQVWFNGRTPAFQAGYVGSIPITCLVSIRYTCAIVAQLVERHLAKVETAGSSPVYRSVMKVMKRPQIKDFPVKSRVCVLFYVLNNQINL